LTGRLGIHLIDFSCQDDSAVTAVTGIRGQECGMLLLLLLSGEQQTNWFSNMYVGVAERFHQSITV